MEHILPPAMPSDGAREVSSGAAITGGIGHVCYPQPGDMVASAYRGLDKPAREVAEILGMVPQLLGLAVCVQCHCLMDITVGVPAGTVYYCNTSSVRHLHRVDASLLHHWTWTAYLNSDRRAPIPDQGGDATTKRTLYLRHLHAVELDPRDDAPQLITALRWRTT